MPILFEDIDIFIGKIILFDIKRLVNPLTTVKIVIVGKHFSLINTYSEAIHGPVVVSNFMDSIFNVSFAQLNETKPTKIYTRHIEDYRILTKHDYPLLIGYKYKSPLLTQLLK